MQLCSGDNTYRNIFRKVGGAFLALREHIQHSGGIFSILGAKSEFLQGAE